MIIPPCKRYQKKKKKSLIISSFLSAGETFGKTKSFIKGDRGRVSRLARTWVEGERKL